MNFPLFIARRYLIAKKSHNVINLISIVSVVGVAVGTMALIILLSVFNGFDSLVHSLFNTFDPDIKITARQGKTFPDTLTALRLVEEMPEVSHCTKVVEENALLRYGKKQYIATIKGVSDDFLHMSGIDTMMTEGSFTLWEKGKPMAIVGQGIAMNLSIGLNFLNPIVIYVPRRSERVSLDPEKAFNRNYIFPSGFFAIQQDFDTKYIIVPLAFASKLLEYNNQISALELKLAPEASLEETKAKIREQLGTQFYVRDRYEQQSILYRIMKTEKWAIFFILAFILIIASFNIVGSLTMLIIDKTEDILTLKSLGADSKTIRKIFLFEGWLISLSGALIGLVLGFGIAWIQMKFGIIKIPGSGSFVIDTYPVVIKISDFFIILFTVSAIGYLAAWYPVQFISHKLKLKLFTRIKQ